MAVTLTRQCTLIDLAGNVNPLDANISYITDPDRTNNAKMTIKAGEELKRNFILAGFNFSDIPDNARLDKISLISKFKFLPNQERCFSQQTSCNLVKTIQFVNGEEVYSFTCKGERTQRCLGFYDTIGKDSWTLTEEAPFTNLFGGTTAASIKGEWTNFNNYTGVGFLAEGFYSAAAGFEWIYPKYFDLEIEYSISESKIYVGSAKAKSVYVGGTKAKAVYLGDAKIL